MEFQIQIQLQETNNTTLLTAMEWFVSNYGAKIHTAQADGLTNLLGVTVIEATYTEAVSILQTIKVQFDEKLIVFKLIAT